MSADRWRRKPRRMCPSAVGTRGNWMDSITVDLRMDARVAAVGAGRGSEEGCLSSAYSPAATAIQVTPQLGPRA